MPQGRRVLASVFLDASLAALALGVRIDVLMWDTREPRNFAEPRGDASDLETMCYHLLTNAFRTRPDGSGWQLRFGHKAGVRWPSQSDCTGATARSGPIERLLFVDFARKASHAVRDASEVDPGGSVTIRLASLFAVVCTFSRQRHDRFEEWCRLAADERRSAVFDATEAANFALIAYLSAGAKKAKLGVSLSSSQGLRTRDGRRPLNFWWYEAVTR
jgi:hypothetical protein